MEHKNKIGFVLAIILLILVIGASFATFYYNFLGENNKITAEGAEIEFLESSGEIINLTNSLPMSDKEGKEQSETFDFQVKTTSRSNMDITYGLYIEKLEEDSEYTFFDDSEIKVYLTDFSNNRKTVPLKISNLTNYLLYMKTNNHNNTNVEQKDKYKLRVWIDKDVYADEWNQNTKIQYKFKIGVRTIENQKVNDNFVYSRSTDEIHVGATLESINGYTTDYESLNNPYFLKHNLTNNNTVKNNELCYILNQNVYCVKSGTAYYEYNLNVLHNSFGSNNCSEYDYEGFINLTCKSGNLDIEYSLNDGNVYASNMDNWSCYVDTTGHALCYYLGIG